jgi:formamidopyrimidine-DNA glycosylase
MRKFAKVTLITTTELNKSIDLIDIGPEPLTPEFTFNIFKNRLGKRPNGLIKQVLMDQKILAGIGNIYSDEILWYSGVHPKSRTGNIPHTQLRKMYFEMQRILRRSIELGGDSMSDFRNLAGEKGGFHLHHAAYMQHNKACTKAFCTKIFRQSAGKQAVILKIRIGQRSAHFCPIHQKLF